MLSDRCSDFVWDVVNEYEGKVVIPYVQGLLEGVEWYARPDNIIGYPTDAGSQTDALRRAATRVIERPDDEDALHWLLVLADCVRSFYDSPFDADGWCAWYRKKIENIRAERCPACGTPVREQER
jgi:hypothetical protein